MVSNDYEDFLVCEKFDYDGVIFMGNSVAVLNLL